MYAKFFKRFFDIVLSLAALIVLSGLILILLLVGAIVLKGNPIFVQPRPGKKDAEGRETIFRLLKLRTMSNARDENGDLLPDEQRLGSYGKWLRSTSLDELPSLVNILKGDLSIVGPRPQLVRDMVFMSEEQRHRHDVRPGLTGLAQINGRNCITWEQKFQWDLAYIYGGITLRKDVAIILKTVGKVLKRSNTVREGTVSDLDFGDYLLQKGEVSNELYIERQEEARGLLNV